LFSAANELRSQRVSEEPEAVAEPIEEVPFDERDWTTWKLKKDTLPPGFLTLKDWTIENARRLTCGVNGYPSRYFEFLFDRDHGLYGNRPGNPWRLSRRKWIERFVHIQDKATLKIVPLRLNEAQRLEEAAIVRQERRGVPVRICTLKARQHGTSTHIAAVLLETALRNKRLRALLMGHKKDSATAIQGRLRAMIEGLHQKSGETWRFNIEADNRKEIEFGAPCRAAILFDSAEAPDFRGDTLGFFHALEPGDWPNARAKANAVMQVVPQARGTFIFVEGTAKGDTGWFAETWKAARDRMRTSEDTEGMIALFFPWYLHQNYRWSRMNSRALPAAQAEAIMSTLDDEERRLLQQRYIRRGVGFVHVDVDQLAWRRYAIRELCQNSVENFHQEYPAYADEAFLSSGMRLFDQLAIAAMREEFSGRPLWRGDLVDPDGDELMLATLRDLEMRLDDARDAG